MRLFRTAALLIPVLTALPASAAPAGDWKIHPTFDANVVKVIDTPGKTYFQALGQDYSATVGIYKKKYPFLFEYDKENDEVRSLSRRNALSENIVNFVDYNPQKKYLLVVYDDGNIDIITDDGIAHNIPGLVSADFPSGKGVNSVTYDNAGNNAWLATDFGYIVIDDKKFQIATSNVLNRKINSIGRVADKIVMLDQNSAWTVDASEKFPTADKFKKIDGISNPVYLLPLSSDGTQFAYTTGPYSNLYVATLADGQIQGNNQVCYGNLYNVTANDGGYFLSYQEKMAQLRPDGTVTEIKLPDDLKKTNTGSWNFSNFFFVENRKGLSERKYSDDGGWTVLREAILPNAPGVFRSTAMAYNSKYGMLVDDHSVLRHLNGMALNYPAHLSSYKGGFWDYLAPVYRNPAQTNALTLPSGIALDPDNPDYAYFGSWGSGLVRLNLADPDEIIRFTVPQDRKPAMGTVVEVFEPNGETPPGFILINSPAFDADGNLWAWRFPKEGSDVFEIYVWPADERKKGNLTGWSLLKIDNFPNAFDAFGYVCTHPSNRGYMIGVAGHYDGAMVTYYNGGTPADASDDKYTLMHNLQDQDGAQVNKNNIYSFYEDPSTGLVWVGGSGGVFTMNPRQTINSPGRVNRIKVARNDGTNLADYLLNGVTVYSIEADAAGRKYFATDGGGIVITSADGREIIEQLTTDNSFLPSNTVYYLKYNPENRSMMVSTANGIAEYFPAGSSSGENADAVKIYPNPVRPDYFGWVTIEGLDDGSMVKIVDSAGNLVKELGFASGGSVKWDVGNMNLKRVRSGVYFVLTSAGPGATSSSQVGKILVIN